MPKINKKIFKLSIKGDEWQFVLLTKKQYERQHGKDSGAIINLTDRIAYFRSDELTAEHIRHEVWHLLASKTYTESSNLTADQVEELSAAIFEAEGPYMLYISDLILTALLKK